MPSSKAAHPHAMTPRVAGKTRTAPPMTPASWPTSPRMKAYARFGMTGWIYLVASFLAIEIVWALGSGPQAWADMQKLLASPVLVGIHALCLASVVYVLVRFFALFPKAQPARIGPAKPPPRGVLHGGLYALWIGTAVVLSAILAGKVF